MSFWDEITSLVAQHNATFKYACRSQPNLSKHLELQ